MSNRVRKPRRRNGVDQIHAWLAAHANRRPVRSYDGETLIRLVVEDAVAGRDQGGNNGATMFLWWDTEAMMRVAQIRKVNPDDVFAEVAAKVSLRLGRPWP